MAPSSPPPGLAPSRRVGRRRLPLSAKRSDELTALLLPAIKAFGLGYLMDILPAIIKALLRFTTSELKRIRAQQKRTNEERSLATDWATRRPSLPTRAIDAFHLVAPSLARLPLLLQAILKALVAALGPQGMALSCFCAMAGWKISESMLWWPITKYYALKLSHSAPDVRRQLALTRARVAATFISASVSSALSLMVLQHNSIQADLRAATAAAAAAASGGIAATASGNATKPTTLPPVPTGSDSLHIDTTSSWIPKPLRSPRFGFTAPRAPASVPRIASLAPAGHFLSRLTSLTVPGSPSSGRSPSGGASAQPPVSPDARLPTSPSEARGGVDEKMLQLPSSAATASATEAAVVPGVKSRTPDALGKPSPTIDLTLFALVRGLDTLVRAAPLILASSSTAAAASAAVGSKVSIAGGNAARASPPPRSASRLSRLGSALSDQAEGLIFVVCCAQIMWAWFYHQERLPPTYVKWITNLATMDERLLLALRGMRYGQPIKWSYKDRDITPAGIELVSSLSEELGYPYEWGDPTRIPNTAAEARQMLLEARRANAEVRARGGTVQPNPLRGEGGEPGFVLAGASGPRGRGEMGGLPCEIIHCGVGGASCARNAALRWLRGWRMSMAIYFPVHLLPRLLFNPRGFARQPVRNLAKVVVGAARSAAFLATFIVGNWYPICLARSHLPRLFPAVPFSFWDSGLGPLLGSIACGFSIFIEEKRKRAEMALYVAPRALFAVAESTRNGWLSEGRRSALWCERVIFGMAVGTVVATAKYRPDQLRGITGAMGWVVRRPGSVPAVKGRYARGR